MTTHSKYAIAEANSPTDDEVAGVQIAVTPALVAELRARFAAAQRLAAEVPGLAALEFHAGGEAVWLGPWRGPGTPDEDGDDCGPSYPAKWTMQAASATDDDTDLPHYLAERSTAMDRFTAEPDGTGFWRSESKHADDWYESPWVDAAVLDAWGRALRGEPAPAPDADE